MSLSTDAADGVALMSALPFKGRDGLLRMTCLCDSFFFCFSRSIKATRRCADSIRIEMRGEDVISAGHMLFRARRV
jgi:hypothetical protein